LNQITSTDYNDELKKKKLNSGPAALNLILQAQNSFSSIQISPSILAACIIINPSLSRQLSKRKKKNEREKESMIGLIIEIDKMSMIITNFAIIITINQPKRHYYYYYY